MTPQSLRHGPLERLLLIAEEQELAEFPSHRLRLYLARHHRPIHFRTTAARRLLNSNPINSHVLLYIQLFSIQ